MTRRCYNCGARPADRPSAFCHDCAEAKRPGHPPLPAGSTTCRCGACGRDFATLSGFDAHRPHRDGCGDPADAGLIEHGEIWATPEGHADRARLREGMAAVRARRTTRCDQSQTDVQPEPLAEVGHGR